MIRVALVGCGAMGEIMAQKVYGGLSRCRVVAVVDKRRDRADAVGQRLGVPAVTSLDDVTGIDAVDLRLPHHLHAGVALSAIDRGLHVLIEKPLATTWYDGSRVTHAARRAGVVAAVAENYPHLRAVQATAAAVARGDIGTLLTVRTTRAYTLGDVWTRDGWRQDGGPSSGILLDQGTHHTSLLRAVAGEVDSVAAAASGDTVLLTLWFRSGLVGQSLYTWGSPAVDGEPEATVFGTSARVDIHVSYETDQGRAVCSDGRELSAAENYYDSHQLIVEDWISAIIDHREPLVTTDDALGDLAVVLAAATSIARGGRPVAVTR